MSIDRGQGTKRGLGEEKKREGLRERGREGVIDMKVCKGMLGVGGPRWIQAWGPGKEGEGKQS